MLLVTKKITSESGAEAILRDSYRLSAPLGIPTLILDPADYAREPSFWATILTGDTIEQRVIHKLRKLLYSFYGQGDVSTELFLNSPGRFLTSIINTLEKSIVGNQMAAHSFSHNSLFNVVICPKTQDTGAKLLKYGLKMREQSIPDMPGYDAQWNFIKLWHEFAHGLVGPSEPQADQICGLIHQHVFEDSAPLMAFSDFRAGQAILLHEKEESLRVHGWPLVDTLDHILEQEIPGSWDGIIARAKLPAPADPQIADVQFVGRSLKSISKLAFAEPDLLMLGMMSDNMAYKGNVENENQLRIARRFAIAAQRLSIGKTAYAVTLPKFQI